MVTTDRTAAPSVIVILDARHPAHVSLDVLGPLDEGVLEAALDRIAVGHPGPLPAPPQMLRHGPEHHTLRVAVEGEAAAYPAGRLADLITGAASAGTWGGPSPWFGERARSSQPAGVFAQDLGSTPTQRETLSHATVHPDRHVEQLSWRWHGPLDLARFAAAWQSVFDRETVLRAAFTWDPRPRAVLFRHARPVVVRHAYGSVVGGDGGWAHLPELARLMEREREQGFDLRRPGLLRVALLDSAPPQGGGAVAPTDVVVTYHRTMLDSWSVRLLLREFHHAYLADGSLPGGERRPDLRDYLRWLEGQESAGAQAFWAGDTGTVPAGLGRATAGTATGRNGTGRHRLRLNPEETGRLTGWAARRGVTESSALHAVWAMLLYRASEAGAGPAVVRFDVVVSGRGVPLDGVERIPAPLAGPLPLSVEVDPAGTVAGLLRSLRDRALDMTAYEWASSGQVDEWRGHPGKAEPAESVVVFERWARTAPDPLAALGVRIGHPELTAGPTASPVGIVAQHDRQGGLVLSAVHDRARLEDEKVVALLEETGRLLRELPLTAGESTTVADVLADVPDTAAPRLHDGPEPRPARPTLVPLREAAAPGSGNVCLISPPGAVDTSRGRLVRQYPGAEALTSLESAAVDTRACVTTLEPLLGSGSGLVLGGLSGTGAIAHEIAREIAAAGLRPPLVVVGGTPGSPENAGDDAVDALARTLAAVTGR
ncbi:MULTISPECIES: condensation domain-containing protein [Streptomyces]|uniref:Condensation domain-containing protein n=1 Tax=Streptomyces lienomycini TaxID=284035 RepID=A0ABV9X943_9ACTN|nr:condensation domain-containing protein [Streptomyces sp. NBC_00334]